LSADATSTALADDAPRDVPVESTESTEPGAPADGEVLIEDVLEVTGTGDGSLTEVVVDELVEGGEA
jgi:hypothetical protein